ncbi:hypothetical protein WA026_011207 [Henosepilachna vigintioctopunctata]|uniref:Uncharacterized protein n=1 Tax=Henosepilachna vigintioctopunctata TaxID=420089 RepID=A0AAW1U680_9CUCU
MIHRHILFSLTAFDLTFIFTPAAVSIVLIRTPNQSREENISTAKDIEEAFHGNLHLLSSSLRSNVFESFPSVQKIAEENATQTINSLSRLEKEDDLTTNMKEHLIDFVADVIFKVDRHLISVYLFWIVRTREYPKLSSKAS